MNGYSSHVRIKKDYFTLSYIHLSPATVFGQFDHKFASAQDIIWKSKASHRKQHEPLKGKNPFSFSMWLAWKMKKSWYFSWIISKKMNWSSYCTWLLENSFFLDYVHKYQISMSSTYLAKMTFAFIQFSESSVMFQVLSWSGRHHEEQDRLLRICISGHFLVKWPSAYSKE